LATAILHEADEFDTNEGGGKRKRGGDLIPLSGNVDGYALKILNPLAAQPKLFYGAQTKKESADEKQTRVDEVELSSGTVRGSGSGPAEGQAGIEAEKEEEGGVSKSWGLVDSTGFEPASSVYRSPLP
jgi:hypothetical protein